MRSAILVTTAIFAALGIGYYLGYSRKQAPPPAASSSQPPTKAIAPPIAPKPNIETALTENSPHLRSLSLEADGYRTALRLNPEEALAHLDSLALKPEERAAFLKGMFSNWSETLPGDEVIELVRNLKASDNKHQLLDILIKDWASTDSSALFVAETESSARRKFEEPYLITVADRLVATRPDEAIKWFRENYKSIPSGTRSEIIRKLFSNSNTRSDDSRFNELFLSLTDPESKAQQSAPPQKPASSMAPHQPLNGHSR